jgi:predicted RNase H-like nuclease (RuvC/YqgF family)
MRYANSEKEVLRQRKELENCDKQIKNLMKETEALNKKNKMLSSERERLIHMIDAKVRKCPTTTYLHRYALMLFLPLI